MGIGLIGVEGLITDGLRTALCVVKNAVVEVLLKINTRITARTAVLICEKGKQMRLIDADTIQWTANGCGHPNCKDICDYTKDDGTCCGWLVAHKKDVDNLPTIDAEPIRHGEWILEREPDGKPYCLHCSICDGDFRYIGIKTAYDFCPNCGAKMDGMVEDGTD